MPTAPVLFQEAKQLGIWLSQISAVINGRASATGTLTGSGTLAGTILGHTSDSGTLLGSGQLASVILGTTSDSGILKGAGSLAGVILGHTSDSGTLTSTGSLAGVILGHTAVAGALKGTGTLAGIITGFTSDSGTLSAVGALIGSITGHTVDSGTLKGAGRLNGASTGVASVSLLVPTIAHILSDIFGTTDVRLQNGSGPRVLPFSVSDSRAYGNFPNDFRLVQGTLIYDVPDIESRNPAIIFEITSCTSAVGGQTAYQGTFDPISFPANSYADIVGFVANPLNSGSFQIVSCSSTTLTVVNPDGVAESGVDATVWVDSRVGGAPTDSRITLIIPQNSRFKS